jgi:hypothetical protein
MIWDFGRLLIFDFLKTVGWQHWLAGALLQMQFACGKI